MVNTNQIITNESTSRPAWTSTQSTGMFDAYKHRHCLEKGKFTLKKNYYERK